jgi:DGQHR domain-containing protein
VAGDRVRAEPTAVAVSIGLENGEVAMSDVRELRVPAIEVRQSPGRTLYTFAVEGKLIPAFATISRIRRQDGALRGYQRPEVLAHIGEIRRYLESPSPMIPNAVVIAFDPRVHFEPAVAETRDPDYTSTGTLVIPIDPSVPEDEKPGFIVDGQQRLAAIRDADLESFPTCVTAFITSDAREQTEQFILVNSTKPLPKGLIYELLPTTETALPTLLARRRFPAHLLDRLNRDEGSPLLFMIQTPTTPEGLIKDNSLLRMIENSLTDGVLFRFRGADESGNDAEGMLAVLFPFWRAVKKVFSDAWGLPPRRSRLMHGAGVITLGLIMDAIADRHRHTLTPSEEQFAEDLTALKDVCRWTDGYWDFGPGRQRKWNEIQNTSKDIEMLANHLLTQYKGRVWSRRPGAVAP